MILCKLLHVSAGVAKLLLRTMPTSEPLAKQEASPYEPPALRRTLLVKKSCKGLLTQEGQLPHAPAANLASSADFVWYFNKSFVPFRLHLVNM